MVVAYLMQALVSNPGLPSLPISLYLKETLNLSATDTTLIGIVAMLPWTIKPVWGLVCDSFTLFGSQFRSYFVLCYGLAAIVLLSLVIVPTPGVVPLTIAAVVVSCGIAFSDVVTDRLMVIEGRRTQQTAILQAAQWTAVSFGAAIASWAGGWFAQGRSLAWVSGVTAGLLLIGGVVIWWTLPNSGEPPIAPSLRQTLKTVRAELKHRQLRAILGFLVLLGFSPAPPFLYYARDTLKLSEQGLGTLGAVGALAGGVGAIAFGFMARRLPRKGLLVGAVGMNAVSVLGLLLARSPESAVLAFVLIGFTGMLATLGVLEIAAQVCSLTAAATSFALILSVSNLAMLLGGAIGAWLYDQKVSYESLVLLGVCCTMLTGFLIPWLNLEEAP
jgi:predicted MFS family arabinose efflux permease